MFQKIISLNNLLEAWREFVKNKRHKLDVILFSQNLMDNIFLLYSDLLNHTYIHGGYQHFKINDPKSRDIHKASVRDRLLHHAIYRILYPYFDKKFVFDSYSCRLNKGTHKAINRFKGLSYKVSKNNTLTCWVLKCDIRKFFASINHEILKGILTKYIKEQDTLWLLGQITDSFNTKNHDNVGLPLGNLTSQLLVNIHMNKFDHFIKRDLKVKYYIRYADDFVIVSNNESYLKSLIPQINDFLVNKLKLELHPNKISIRKYTQGIDYLGYITLPKYMLVRTKTKRRMYNKLKKRVKEFKSGLIEEITLKQSLNSYLGVLSHANCYELKQDLLNQFWFWMKE